MIHVVLDILILIFATLTYREMKVKKPTSKKDGGWRIMNAYRDSAKAERERGLKNNDKTS